MGWHKLKGVLAGVLAAVNLFLLYMVREQARALDFIPDEAVEKLISLLEEDSIYLAEGALNREKQSPVIYGGVLSETYYKNVAESLSDSRENLFFTTPNGVVMTVDSGARFAFASGFGIRYEAAGFSELLLDSGFFETEVTRFADNARIVPLEGGDSRRVTAAVSRFLAETSDRALTDMLSYDIVNCFTDPETKVNYAVCTQKIKDTEVTNLKAAFAVLDGTVIGMNGRWCFESVGNTYSAQLYDQLHILYSVKERIREENGPVPAVIESVSLVYAVYYHADSDGFYLIPTWRVTVDNGREFLFNAVDGRYKQSDA